MVCSVIIRMKTGDTHALSVQGEQEELMRQLSRAVRKRRWRTITHLTVIGDNRSVLLSYKEILSVEITQRGESNVDEIKQGFDMDLSKTFDTDENFNKVPHFCPKLPIRGAIFVNNGERCQHCGETVKKN